MSTCARVFLVCEKGEWRQERQGGRERGKCFDVSPAPCVPSLRLESAIAAAAAGASDAGRKRVERREKVRGSGERKGEKEHPPSPHAFAVALSLGSQRRLSLMLTACDSRKQAKRAALSLSHSLTLTHRLPSCSEGGKEAQQQLVLSLPLILPSTLALLTSCCCCCRRGGRRRGSRASSRSSVHSHPCYGLLLFPGGWQARGPLL